MLDRRFVRLTFLFAAAALVLLPAASYPQASQGSVGGNVVDPSGAVVPEAELILTHQATGNEVRGVSGPEGYFAFQNLTPGRYNLTVISPGFKVYVQQDIDVLLGADIRVPIRLALGSQQETIEVVGASPMNYDSGSQEGGIAPDTLENLPVVVYDLARAASIVVLVTGDTAAAFVELVIGQDAVLVPLLVTFAAHDASARSLFVVEGTVRDRHPVPSFA